MGELELVSLTTGSEYINEKYDSFEKIIRISKQLRKAAIDAVKNASPKSKVAVGVLAISAGLINGIVGI